MRASRLFTLTWLLTAGWIVGSLPWLPELIVSGKQPLGRGPYLASMLLPLLAAALCSKPFVRWLGRVAPGQVNLPHRDYWMAESRRDATLERLGEHVSGIGVMVTLLLAGTHLHTLLDSQPAWPQPAQALWWTAGGLLLAGLLLWCWQVKALFPAPPPHYAPPPRRPRRPGEQH
jgi:hypothetical protein